jgi:hypothetical protein
MVESLAVEGYIVVAVYFAVVLAVGLWVTMTHLDFLRGF